MEWIYAVALILEIILLTICMVTSIIEASDPESKAFERVKPYVFLATLTIFPIVIHFFGMMIDLTLVWEIIKEIPNMFVEMITGVFSMMFGCAAP